MECANSTPAVLPTRQTGRMGKPCRRRGLTLIEIMVTLTCMAIAALIVMPALGDRADERLRGAAQVLIADLEFAQSQSMSHGDDPRLLMIDSDKAGYRIVAKSAPTTPVTNPAGGDSYATRFGLGRASGLAGVRVSAYSLGGDDKLGFAVLGQLDQTADASITLQCGARKLVVTIDPTTGEATAGAVQ